MREVSIDQVIEAIELNGYEQGYNAAFDHDDSTIDSLHFRHLNSACAIGQAALNLGADVTSLIKELTLTEFQPHKGSLFGKIVTYNDQHRFTCSQIADKLRKEVKRLKRKIKVEEYGYPNFVEYQGRKV